MCEPSKVKPRDDNFDMAIRSAASVWLQRRYCPTLPPMLGDLSERTMRRRPVAVLAYLLAVLSFATATAIAQPAPKPEPRPEPQPGILSLLPADSVTAHSLATEGGSVPYTATAGSFTLRGQDGKRIAAVFYTAYTRDDPEAAPNSLPTDSRPVTFVFNGGPGAASTYLHLGLVGPQVVDFGDPPAAATARLHDNPASWLRFTDLVLIDPVGTGWSRAADPEDSERFWSVDSDAEAIAKVIALYVAEHGRSGAPKYLPRQPLGAQRRIAAACHRRHGARPPGTFHAGSPRRGRALRDDGLSRHPRGSAAPR